VFSLLARGGALPEPGPDDRPVGILREDGLWDADGQRVRNGLGADGHVRGEPGDMGCLITPPCLLVCECPDHELVSYDASAQLTTRPMPMLDDVPGTPAQCRRALVLVAAILMELDRNTHSDDL
jgi:hypothetical protein